MQIDSGVCRAKQLDEARRRALGRRSLVCDRFALKGLMELRANMYPARNEPGPLSMTEATRAFAKQTTRN